MNGLVIGVTREINPQESRVGLTPAGVDALVRSGHQVLVEQNAGAGSGFSDEAYRAVGARMVSSAEAWQGADMIIKVKEPLAQEWDLFRQGQVIFTYFHLAPEPELTRALIEKKVVAISYETV